MVFHQDVLSHEIIILGDLNSRVGKKNNDKVVGRYGEDNTNNNGERLIDICDQNGLRIMNGYFQHRNIHKYTWTQETRNLKSVIDYVILKQKSRLKTTDVRACRGPICGSDHYLLRSDISFPPKIEKETPQGNHSNEQLQEVRYNLNSLHQESVKNLYKRRLEEKLIETEDNTRNVNQSYENIKECIHAAALEALGRYEKTVHRKPYWWDQDISQEITKKRELYQKYLNTKNVEDRIHYKRMQARVRRKICQKKNELWTKKCTMLNTYIGGSQSSESWKLLKNLRNDRKKDIIQSISPQTWERYFEDLLTETREPFKQIQSNGIQSVRLIGSPIRVNEREVETICKQLKNGKSPGPGNIAPELIKYGPKVLIKRLRQLFQQCLNNHEIPKEWKESHLSTIHKKGDKSKPENYRGIAVTSSISRIYGKLIKNRIEEEYQNMEAEEQAGFRAGRSTIDHVFSITQIIEKKVARGQEVHLMFVDLRKAYDSVPLVKLWEALEKTNVNIELVEAVKTLYYQQTTRIKTGNLITPGFTVTKGLRQGCCISPTLFKIYLEAALNKWKKKCTNMGIPLTDSTLYTLCFADDQVIIAQDSEDLSYMMRKLLEEFTEWGLEVNMEKTEYMSIGGDQHSLRVEENQEIKLCEDYKYLGVKITQDGKLDAAIKERNIQGRKGISLLNSVLWDKNISKENKKRIYNTIIKSITTYGCEVWPLKDRTEKMLRATEMDFWRRSAGISRRDRITNERVREIMGVTHTIVDDIRTKQLSWYGHVRRMPENRIPRQILEWQPRGRRRPGRPRRSWREGVDREIRDRELEDDLWNDRTRWRLEIGRRRRTL